MSRYSSSYPSAGVSIGSYDRPEQSVSTIMNYISKVQRLSTLNDIQGYVERMLKVNPFARALIFTKNGFSGVFLDEK